MPKKNSWFLSVVWGGEEIGRFSENLVNYN